MKTITLSAIAPLGPGLPFMPVNALSNWGQPNAVTGKILLGMEALKDAKLTILVLPIKSNLVLPIKSNSIIISHSKSYGVLCVVTIHIDVENGAIADVLQLIQHKILLSKF